MYYASVVDKEIKLYLLLPQDICDMVQGIDNFNLCFSSQHDL